MNILLALFIYICIYMNINYYVTSKISNESTDENLSSYGLEVGDEIYKINGERTYNDIDIKRIVSNSEEDEFEFEVIRNDKHITKNILIPKEMNGYIGTIFEGTKIYDVLDDAPGAKAGLQKGDIIIGIDELKDASIEEYLKYIKSNPNKEINIKISREEEEVEKIYDIKITPIESYKRTLLVDYIIFKDLDFAHNFYYAWNETKYYLRETINGYIKLFSGKAENVEMQGIIGISNTISNTTSYIEFFYLMSAISLSLGIMNLLPIPGLDGGKILFTLIELIRRKPISKETEAKYTMVGFALLLILMVYVTIGDVSKII